MSSPAIPAEPGPVTDRGSAKARSLGTWSLLMLPMLLVSGIAGGFLGFWLLGRKDLEGSEPMSVQGAYGWMTFVLSTAIFMAPMVVGIVLGVKAWRGGARRLGMAGTLIDGAILVVYPFLSTVNLLGQ
jgi:hypothetical protein